MSSNIQRNIQAVTLKLDALDQITDAERGKGVRLARGKRSENKPGKAVTKTYDNWFKGMWKLLFKGGKYQTLGAGKEKVVTALKLDIRTLSANVKALSESVLNQASLNVEELQELRATRTSILAVVTSIDQADRRFNHMNRPLTDSLNLISAELRGLNAYIEMRELELTMVIRDGSTLTDTSNPTEILQEATRVCSIARSLARNGVSSEHQAVFQSKLSEIRGGVETRTADLFSDALQRDWGGVRKEGEDALGHLRTFLEVLDGHLRFIDGNKQYSDALKSRLKDAVQDVKIRAEGQIVAQFSSRLDTERDEATDLNDLSQFKTKLDDRLDRIEKSRLYSPELKVQLKQQIFNRYVQVASRLIDNAGVSLNQNSQGADLRAVMQNLVESHAILQSVLSQLEKLQGYTFTIVNEEDDTQQMQVNAQDMGIRIKDGFDQMIRRGIEKVGAEIDEVTAYIETNAVKGTQASKVAVKDFDTVKKELTEALATTKSKEFEIIRGAVANSTNIVMLSRALGPQIRNLQRYEKALEIVLTSHQKDSTTIQILPGQKQDYECIQALKQAQEDLQRLQEKDNQKNQLEGIQASLDTWNNEIRALERTKKQLTELKPLKYLQQS